MSITKKQSANNSIFSKQFRVQTLASLTVHIMTFSHGIGLGWLSPALLLLQSAKTPLDFAVTVEEASWIGSLFGLGSLAGNIIFGILLDRIGRKWCMYLVALPHMTFWILTYCSQSVEFLYIARFMGGITGGANYVVVPIFIGEVADASIRGALSSMAMMFVTFGILVGFVLASYLDYFLMPCIIIVLPIVYLIASSFLRETPQYLLKKGDVAAAELSYRFYKNMGAENGIANTEAQIKHLEFNELKRTMLKGTVGSEVTLKDFFNKPAMKIFLTAFVIVVLNQFSGSFAFVNYMSYIFSESGTTMDPNTATIIIGVVQIAGTCAASVLVDRFGRRVLMLSSAGGMGVSLIAFGLFTQYATKESLEYLSWVPLVLMMFVVFIASIGVVALLFVVIVEILPTKIRSISTAICMGFLSCMVFVALKIYPLLVDGLGISTTMYMCAGVCLSSFIYLAILLPETKGKSMDFD